jgi:hypothetical protein
MGIVEYISVRRKKYCQQVVKPVSNRTDKVGFRVLPE